MVRVYVVIWFFSVIILVVIYMYSMKSNPLIKSIVRILGLPWCIHYIDLYVVQVKNYFAQCMAIMPITAPGDNATDRALILPYVCLLLDRIREISIRKHNGAWFVDRYFDQCLPCKSWWEGWKVPIQDLCDDDCGSRTSISGFNLQSRLSVVQ